MNVRIQGDKDICTLNIAPDIAEEERFAGRRPGRPCTECRRPTFWATPIDDDHRPGRPMLACTIQASSDGPRCPSGRVLCTWGHQGYYTPESGDSLRDLIDVVWFYLGEFPAEETDHGLEE